MVKSFLQTKEWLEFQKSIGHQGWHFAVGNGDGGRSTITANVIRHDVPFGKNYLYIPHGPFIAFDQIQGGIKNELAHFVAYLKNLAREQKSIFVKIEPLDDKVPEVLHQFGFKKSSKEIQPKKSVILNLDKTERELLAEMHHKTRYNIKVAERHELQFTESRDLEAFWDLLERTAKADRFFTHERSYYENLLGFVSLRTKMFLVEKDDKPIAGAIILSHNGIAYYLHGAMDRDSAHGPMMAPYLLHWEIIKWAKAAGLKQYDLWGIDAVRWPGVTRFKLGWGGQQVEYPGSFDLRTSKFWYFVYKLFQKIR